MNENHQILQRLSTVSPTYKHQKYAEERNRQEHLISNISRYPYVLKTESQQKLMQSSPQLTKGGKSNNNLNSSYASRYTLYKLSQDPKAASRSRVAQSMRQTKYKLKTKPIEQRYSILRDSANVQTADSKDLKHELMPDESSVMLSDPQVDLSFEDIERMNDSQARQVRR